MECIIPIEVTVGFPPIGFTTKDMYVKMGIVIIDKIGKYKYKATLPNNWKIEHGHDTTFYLYDDESRIRAWFFYYESDKPLVSFKERYQCKIRKTEREDVAELFGVILDGGKDEIYRTKPIISISDDFNIVNKKLYKQLNKFLDKNFPDWATNQKTDYFDYVPNTYVYWDYKQ